MAKTASKPNLRVVATTTKSRAPRANVRVPKAPGVVQQVAMAFRRKNALATGCGVVLGGFVPVATYLVSHHEASLASAHGVAMLTFVLGGLLFSAKTVWQWGRLAFQDAWKATGFVLIIEGAMTLSSVPGLGLAALCLLTIVNGIATGVALSRS